MESLEIVSYPWDPIEDLPEDWLAVARPDLDEMLSLWNSEKSSLSDNEKIDRLQQQLSTRWAIETGIIERLYTIDRGTTETLVELGLDAIQQFSTSGRLTSQAVKLIEDQRAALDFVFSYLKDERPLTISYIKELHQLLLRNQDYTEAVDSQGNRFKTELLKGKWKELANNPLTPDGTIHEYCPPDFVQDEMEQLLAWHERHVSSNVRPEVEAAWLHHRFTQIHPFQDGNGRVARAIATMVFLKSGFLPLVIRDIEHRESYIHALESADGGDIGPLVNLFSNIQAKDLDDAITFVRDMRGEGIRSIAASAASAVKRRVQQDEDAIIRKTDRLVEITEARFREVAFELGQAFLEAGITLRALVEQNDELYQDWWNHQIVNAAKSYRYFVDLGRFRRWVRLRLEVVDINVARWQIVVSFHHKELRVGLMAAVVFLTASRAEYEDARPGILGSENEFTYSSSSSLSEKDYKEWLEKAIGKLLEEWQSRI